MSNTPIQVFPAGAMPAVQVTPANPLQQMAMELISKGGDLSQLDKLLDLQFRWDQDQARKAYADSMATAQAEMPAVYKDRYNIQTDSYYATLESINTKIMPIYTRHGFSLSFDTEDSPVEKCIRIVCRVLHYKGHSETFRYDQPIDDVGIAGKVNKTQVHARGSAMTYGRRYLTLMIFNLTASDDDDGNSATREKVDANAPTTDAKVAAFNEAHGRLSESMAYIKERMVAGDFKAAAGEWYQFNQQDQMALYLAPTKAPEEIREFCFTTEQRSQMKDEFGKYKTTQQEPENGN